MANVERLPGSADVSSTTYYSTGALPSAGDSLYLAEGEDALASGMTALQGIDLALIAFGPRCKSTITGTPLSITADRTNTGIVQYEGSANGTLKFTGGTDNDVAKLRWWPTAGARGEFYAIDFLVSIEVTGGTCVIAGSSTAACTVYVLGGTCILEPHATDTVTAINCWGGTTWIRRAFTTLTVRAGATVYIDLDTYSGGTINNDGGYIIWMSGNVTTLNNWAGTLDTTKFYGIGQGATNYSSTANARVIVSTGGIQPTLGPGTGTSIGSSRGAAIAYAGSSGGLGFGLTG